MHWLQQTKTESLWSMHSKVATDQPFLMKSVLWAATSRRPLTFWTVHIYWTETTAKFTPPAVLFEWAPRLLWKHNIKHCVANRLPCYRCRPSVNGGKKKVQELVGIVIFHVGECNECQALSGIFWQLFQLFICRLQVLFIPSLLRWAGILWRQIIVDVAHRVYRYNAKIQKTRNQYQRREEESRPSPPASLCLRRSMGYVG